MKCWLALLLALSAWSAPAAEPSVTGVWRCRRADGSGEVLELIAGGRFVWRDDTGAAASGEMVLADGSLRLRARGAERIFACRLREEGLELSAPPADLAVAMSGDLARMSPRLGAPAVTWRRPGWVPDPPELRVQSLADLAGPWRMESLPGRVDRLDLSADGFFTFTGPGGLIARGRAAWQGGVLTFSADGLTRRLAARLRVSNRGWSLVLLRMPDDQPAPTGDLAEMPPCLSQQAIWRRDLEPPLGQAVFGRYAATDAGGVTHALSFEADGRFSLHRGTRLVGQGTWRTEGLVLTFTLTSDAGFDEVRRWTVQRLAESLIVWRAADDASPGDRAATVDLPPGEGELARYEPMASPSEVPRP